jgi:hypothetical protein
MPTLSAINDVQHWRDRAAEMHALSVTMRDTETIGVMLRLAEDYDLLADRAAERAGRDSNIRSPRPHD